MPCITASTHVPLSQTGNLSACQEVQDAREPRMVQTRRKITVLS